MMNVVSIILIEYTVSKDNRSVSNPVWQDNPKKFCSFKKAPSPENANYKRIDSLIKPKE